MLYHAWAVPFYDPPGTRRARPGKDKSRNPEGLRLSLFIGAEGETRTPTAIQRLDPEPSASTSSATSARSAITF